MKSYHVYVLSPIDMGWELCRKVSDVAIEFCDSMKLELSEGIKKYCWANDMSMSYVKQFIDQYNESLKAAQKSDHWDGDMRHEPVVIPLPDDTECDFGFMWKQDNNGTTFVVLPHFNERLKEISYHYAKIYLE